MITGNIPLATALTGRKFSSIVKIVESVSEWLAHAHFVQKSGYALEVSAGIICTLLFLARGIRAVKLGEKTALFQVVDEAEVDKILRPGFCRFGIPGRLHR